MLPLQQPFSYSINSVILAENCKSLTAPKAVRHFHVKMFLYTPRRHMGAWKYSPIHSLPLHKMEVSVSALTALLLVKGLYSERTRRSAGPKSGLDASEEKCFLPLPGIEPGFLTYSVRSLVIILTKLFRLHMFQSWFTSLRSTLPPIISFLCYTSYY